MQTSTQPYAAQRADGTAVTIDVAEGRIAALTPRPYDPALPHVLPILVDLQHNGALGFDFSKIDQCGIGALRQIATFMRRHGVGRCLPTLVTHSHETLAGAVTAFDQWLASDPSLAQLFRGLFSEGCYISPRDGWRGVHNPQWIRPPDWEQLTTLDRLSGNRIRMVNLAPEEPGGLDFVAQAVAAGKLVALGHCCPDAATVRAAAARGASLVTHFGNGAAASIPRFDNPFWAMLNEPRLRLGLIGDGFHLPPDLVGTAMRAKGPEGCFMVSDAAHISGCPAGRYDNIYAAPSVIEPNGHLHLADSTMLAGAWFQLDRSVEWLVQTQGLSLREAWRYCSEIPARILGEALPQLDVGTEASFVLAHWENGLVIDQSLHNGTPYLASPIRPTDCTVEDSST